MGTHEELMTREGHYREIAYAQLRGDDVTEGPGDEIQSHMDRVQVPGIVEEAQENAEKGAMTGETLGK
jgi:hypothetical protein